MPTKERMTINERLKYLRIIRLRYVRADRPGRTQLLDEMAKVTDLERKTLIRLLHGDLARHHRQKQRGRTYGPEVAEICMFGSAFSALSAVNCQ
jgi:hypothetical protein